MGIKDELLDCIYKKDSMQHKKISKVLSNNSKMEEDLIVFLNTYKIYMKSNHISNDDLVDAYLSLVNQMLYARIEFMHTGEYPVQSQSEATINVYNNSKVMTNYMLGLALSQFLWKHHYLLLEFYKNQLKEIKPQGDFLEVGSGHGLFTMELLKKNFDNSKIDIVDISQTSLDITKGILEAIIPDSLDWIHFYNNDINDFKVHAKYDFITMGEVLEHVDDPITILRSLHSFLKDDGKFFITTCVNSPAIDHVYHFRSIKEITSMFEDTGFTIVSEIIVPSEDKSPEIIEKYKLDILYAAILEKK